MEKPVLIILMISVSLFSCFSQERLSEFDPAEIDQLVIVPMTFSLKSNSKEVLQKYGRTSIAVKFNNIDYYNPNKKKKEKGIDYYYIFSEKGVERTVWGMVTKDSIFSNTGIKIKSLVIQTDDQILCLSNEVISHPLAVSFCAIEKTTNKTYVTEMCVLLGLNTNKKMVEIIPMDFY